jgi:hypothetical protein
MSKVNPSANKTLALPPVVGFFSNTVTSQPALAMNAAAESPANPLPMMTIFFKSYKKMMKNGFSEN